MIGTFFEIWLSCSSLDGMFLTIRGCEENSIFLIAICLVCGYFACAE